MANRDWEDHSYYQKERMDNGRMRYFYSPEEYKSYLKGRQNQRASRDRYNNSIIGGFRNGLDGARSRRNIGYRVGGAIDSARDEVINRATRAYNTARNRVTGAYNTARDQVTGAYNDARRHVNAIRTNVGRDIRRRRQGRR